MMMPIKRATIGL